LEVGYITGVNSWVIKPGARVRLGNTMPDKSFAYVYQAPNSFLEPSASINSINIIHLGSIFINRYIQITNLFQYGNRFIGYTMMARIELGNLVYYWIELDNVINDQEILRP
jgi:hypothetical protein